MPSYRVRILLMKTSIAALVPAAFVFAPALSHATDAVEAVDASDQIVETRTVRLASLLEPVANFAETPEQPANGFRAGDTTVTFGGYIKLDMMLTDFLDGSLPTNSLGRDFYLPALIPVGGDGDSAPVLDFNPRETRFLFGFDTKRGDLDIGGRIEFDFQVTQDGNERVSNSYTPRMRQAYVTINNWLFGQAWSTFQDVAALPDNLDFIGPSESTTFERQPMIRYTRGAFQFAIEQPELTIADVFNGGARITPGEDFAPDVVARYNHKRGWGHVTATSIVRALHVEENPGAAGRSATNDDTVIGYGVAVSGKVKVADRDDVRFMATAGDGVGRYIGLNLNNDAVIDANGDLDTISTLSAFASYRHFWTETARSNLTYGWFSADKPISQGAALTETAQSVHANFILTPAPKVDIGVEYIYAMRELTDGTEGAIHRLQFSAKFGF